MYYPTLKEFLILAVIIVELIGAGYLIKRRWTARNEPVPVTVALIMWLGMFLIYFSVTSMLYYMRTEAIATTHGPALTPDELAQNVDAVVHAASSGHLSMTRDPRLTVMVTLGWALLMWCVPAWYFTRTLAYSIAARNIDRIDPFSAKIEDPSEFAAARKLALRGDIDGAVSMYRTYKDNHVNALFEAARLLKSEDRFAEAAEILTEIAEKFQGKTRVWADATYQLAKLYETHLPQPELAKQSLRSILDRAPETRFAHLASADLARLQILTGNAPDLDLQDSPQPDPFYKPAAGRAETVRRTGRKASTPAPVASFIAQDAAPETEDMPIPVQDPFLAARLRARETTAAQVADGVASATAKPGKRAKAPAKKAANNHAAPAQKAAPKAKPKAKLPPTKASKPAARKKDTR